MSANSDQTAKQSGLLAFLRGTRRPLVTVSSPSGDGAFFPSADGCLALAESVFSTYAKQTHDDACRVKDTNEN